MDYKIQVTHLPTGTTWESKYIDFSEKDLDDWEEIVKEDSATLVIITETEKRVILNPHIVKNSSVTFIPSKE